MCGKFYNEYVKLCRNYLVDSIGMDYGNGCLAINDFPSYNVELLPYHYV